MVKLTIDNKEIEVPEGTTVLEAAKSAGVHIPTLCYHPALTPYGGCRLCLVEVQGARTLQPSCTLPVNNGMVVTTESDQIRDARKFVLNMIFSERNHLCPYCVVSGGDCELQNSAYSVGMTHWAFQPNWEPFAVDASHPYIIMEQDRCILCHRCIRACGELVGNYTLGVQERGSKSRVIADLGIPLGESSCISCGVCVQICPTGSLIDRWSAYRGQETDVQHNESICVGCSVGCSIDVETRNNSLVRIEGNWEGQPNKGILCEIGRFQPMDDARERISAPMVRKDGKLTATTWDEALDTITEKIKPLIGHSEDGVAATISTRLPAETIYLFKEIFKKGIKSDMVTSLEEGRYTALPYKVAAEMGKPFEGKFSALEDSDCYIVIGADLVKNHQVAGFFIKRKISEDVKLVVIDPKDNPLDNMTGFTLKASSGADLDWLQCLSAAVIQSGLAKSESSLDADALLAAAKETTGISADEYLSLAEAICSSKNPTIVYGKGITEKNSVQTLKALVELGKLIGAIGADFSNLISTKGEANSMAAAQYDLEDPFQLNGHQAVFVAIGDEAPTQRFMQQVEKAPFLAVQAAYVSHLTANADVVLPVTIWNEQEGSYISMDGEVRKAVKAIESPESVWSNQAVLEALAKRLDIKADGDWKAELLKRVSPVSING